MEQVENGIQEDQKDTDAEELSAEQSPPDSEQAAAEGDESPPEIDLLDSELEDELGDGEEDAEVAEAEEIESFDFNRPHSITADVDFKKGDKGV